MVIDLLYMAYAYCQLVTLCLPTFKSVFLIVTGDPHSMVNKRPANPSRRKFHGGHRSVIEICSAHIWRCVTIEAGCFKQLSPHHARTLYVAWFVLFGRAGSFCPLLLFLASEFAFFVSLLISFAHVEAFLREQNHQLHTKHLITNECACKCRENTLSVNNFRYGKFSIQPVRGSNGRWTQISVWDFWSNRAKRRRLSLNQRYLFGLCSPEECRNE